MNNESQDSCVFQFENKAQDLFIISETPEPVRKRPVEMESFVETKKKSPLNKKQMNESELTKTKSESTEISVVKKEPKIKKENKTFNHRGHETSLVYSKLNPPSCLAKQSQLNQSSTIQASAQIVVKYEPLVKIKTLSSYENSNYVGKKNFKKFKKVPKANKKESQSFFKSFKHEEFNVDSQFQLFMSSNK